MQHSDVSVGDFVDVTLSLRWGYVGNVFLQRFRFKRVIKILSRVDVGVRDYSYLVVDYQLITN